MRGMARITPPYWADRMGNMPLALFLEYPGPDGKSVRDELVWPKEMPLPEAGEHLTRRDWEGKTREHVVTAVRWDLVPSTNSVRHHQPGALVVVASGYINID